MTRRFLPEPLDAAEVDEVLDLARRAPSAGFSQGTHFLVLRDEELAGFWTCTGADEWFARTQPGVLAAPLVVLPLADRSAYTERYSAPDKAGHGLETAEGWTMPYWLLDTAMATQQLLLLAEDRGWGALFFGVFRGAEELARQLGLPESVTPIGAVALGRRAPTDQPTGSPGVRARRPAAAVVHHGRWQGSR